MTGRRRRRRSVLAEALQLPDYKGDARSAIQLDFCSYNLSFAQSAGFSATQTSAVVTLAMDLLTAIGDGAGADDLKEAFKSSLVPLLSVKSAELAAYRCVLSTTLLRARGRAVYTAQPYSLRSYLSREWSHWLGLAPHCGAGLDPLNWAAAGGSQCFVQTARAIVRE